MEKMKTYVLILSKTFPKTHSRAGGLTYFRNNFEIGQLSTRGLHSKLHTIRPFYRRWEKRIKDVQEGKAVLSIREWTGKPYSSKQEEIAQLTAADGVGIQRLTFDKDKDGVHNMAYGVVNGKDVDTTELADHDGLCKNDWLDWFRNADKTEPLAIIHFTKFRY